MSYFTDAEQRAQALLDSRQSGSYDAPAAARAARLTVYLRFDEGGAEHAHQMKLQLTRAQAAEACEELVATFVRFYNRRHRENKQTPEALALKARQRGSASLARRSRARVRYPSPAPLTDPSPGVAGRWRRAAGEEA